MKSFLLPLTFVLSVTVTSCGKKAKEKDSASPEKHNPSVEEVYFNAYKDLVDALEKKDEDKFIKIVTENPGIDLNEIISKTGETFFITTIKQNLNKIRVFLVETERVSFEKANVHGETPLMAAVKSKNEKVVSLLLDRNVNLEKRNKEEDTALHIALKSGNDKMALLLIKEGANIHAFDKYHNNALALADRGQTPEAFELINNLMNIETGAPKLVEFKRIVEKADIVTLRKVLSRYPIVATDKAYQAINPLALLVDTKDETNALASAELLIKHDANVNGPENAEVTPLIKATMALKKGFAGLYLTHDANPQFRDKDGKTALIHAVELNNEEIAKLLVDNGANVEYEFLKNGKRVKFDACDTVSDVSKRLSTSEDKATNKRIKKLLGCGFFSRFF